MEPHIEQSLRTWLEEEQEPLDQSRILEAWDAQVDDGLLWTALRSAIHEGPTGLSPWWNALTRQRGGDPPAWIVINRGRGGDAGTLAVVLIACARLASLAMPDDGDGKTERWSGVLRPHFEALVTQVAGALEEPGGFSKAALDLARFDFAHAARRPASGATPAALSTMWADRVRHILEGACWPSHVRRLSAAWAWEAVCDLLELTRRDRVFCRVPALGYLSDTGTGVLCTLEVEVCDDAMGGIVHDPRHAFVASPEPGFCDSMRVAWEVARRDPKLQDGRWSNTAGGRWRLYEGWNPANDHDAIRSVLRDADDWSASGAALRAWMHALRGWRPDDEVVVIAKVAADGSGMLGLGADGIAAKVRCARDAKCFDTIVLSDLEDARIAAAQLGPPHDIRVVLINDTGTFVIGPDGAQSPLDLGPLTEAST